MDNARVVTPRDATRRTRVRRTRTRETYAHARRGGRTDGRRTHGRTTHSNEAKARAIDRVARDVDDDDVRASVDRADERAIDDAWK